MKKKFTLFKVCLFGACLVFVVLTKETLLDQLVKMTKLGISIIFALPLLAAAQSYNLTALFQSVLSPGAEIYYANDSNWTQEVTQRWSTWDAPTYLGAIKPATERDVQNIVCIQTEH
jgi:hypothetical protein